MSTPYTIIIGLEVHVQLATKSKLFCRCATTFGASPNTQTCPVCLGLPGALPVMNRDAVKLSIKTAQALNLKIPEKTKWDRKSYYYPDLPKGYQISQFDLPISANGFLEIEDPKGRFPKKQIGIVRAHLEEDAGKSTHDEQAGKADTQIDLNRCGTPLLEIVSQPDIRSPLEARAYLTELKLLLSYIGVSDCNMQEGSLRVDANVNLHIPVDETAPSDREIDTKNPAESDTLIPIGSAIATPIVEIKNVNSFRAVERAIQYEADRQYQQWQDDGLTIKDAPKQTRGWDDDAEVTRPQREKEESSDYRYFPDPDLVPLYVKETEIEAIRQTMGELPAALRVRLESEYGITPYDSDVIVSQGRKLADYYIEIANQCGDGKIASNWIQQDVLRTMNEREISITNFPVTAKSLGELISKVIAGEFNTSRGQEVLAYMIDHQIEVDSAISELGIEQVDESDLRALCQRLIETNPKTVADVKEGKLKAAGSLIGQAKKENPNVDPARVREICIEIIQGM